MCSRSQPAGIEEAGMKLIADALAQRITPKSDFLLRLETRQTVALAFSDMEAEKAARDRAAENARLLGREVIYPPNNVSPIRQ
jgi:hypothetical protein